MDGGAWWATVRGVAKSQTRLSDFTFTFHSPALEKQMATHSSVLAWRVPGTGEPGGLSSMESHRVGHDWSDLAAAAVAAYFYLVHFLSVGMYLSYSFLLSFLPSLLACVCVHLLSHVRFFVTLWTLAHEAPLSMGFSRQKYWSGLPFPPPGDLSDPGIECMSPVSPVLAGEFFTTEPPGKHPRHLPFSSLFKSY